MYKYMIILLIFVITPFFILDAEDSGEEALKAIHLDQGNFPGLRSLCEEASKGKAFKDVQAVLGYKLEIDGSKITCQTKDGKSILRLDENSSKSDNEIVKTARAIDALYKPINEDNQPILGPLAKCAELLKTVDGKGNQNCINQMNTLTRLAGSSPAIIALTRFVLNECKDAATVCPENGDTKEQFTNLQEVSQSLSALGHSSTSFPNCVDLNKRLTTKLNAQDAVETKAEAKKLADKKKKATAAKKKTTSALTSLMGQLNKTISSMSQSRSSTDYSPPAGGSVQSDFIPTPIPPEMPPNFSNSGQLLLQNESVLTLWHKRGYRFAGQHRLQQILRTDHEVRGKIAANLESRGIPATMSNMIHYVQELTSGE